MPKRERAAESSRPANMSEELLDKGRANLAKGRAARAAQIKANRDPHALKASEKWAMLLSGQLTVKDMDDEELKRAGFRNRDGVFGGAPRAVPSHISQAISNERVRRAKANILDNADAAVQVLLAIMNSDDPDVVKTADKLKAAVIVMEHTFGKAQSTVVIKGDDPWGNLTSTAMETDRDLANLLDEEDAT